MTAPARWRLLDTGEAAGDWNMACDEAILEAHRQGLVPPTLRFYRWSRPTLSLGYAQKLETVDLEACKAAGVDVVRRPTGGRAVLHAGDFTYSVVAGGLPSGVSASYRYLAAAIARSLSHLSLESQLVAGSAAPGRSADCFATATQADLCVAERKLMGNAQVRRAGVVLQHGSLYLNFPVELADRVLPESAGARPIDLATALGTEPDWDTVREAFIAGFAEYLGGTWEPGALTADEKAQAERLKKAYRVKVPQLR